MQAFRFALTAAASVFAASLAAQTVSLDSLQDLKLVQVKAEPATYKGRKGLRVTDAAPRTAGDAGRLAILANTTLQDGTIEIDMSGDVGPGAAEGARGFVGLAFRVTPDASRFECFYIRPTNGRADDQVRRNHSLQYISIPGFPWPLLRKEFPEKYESYADLVPGEWTKLKIEIQGDKARLYVLGATQPSLLVNDLKQPVAPGAIALWVGPGTVAHFANLKITKR
jgi:hypothetical protein